MLCSHQTQSEYAHQVTGSRLLVIWFSHYLRHVFINFGVPADCCSNALLHFLIQCMSISSSLTGLCDNAP